MFFATKAVQNKVQSVFSLSSNNLSGTEAREMKFSGGKVQRLSEMVGMAMCAEQAALGQFLLQGCLIEGFSSSYMGGVYSGSIKGGFTPDGLNPHSFIVLCDPQDNTYIFDIARPHSGTNLPRLLAPVVPFKLDLFEETDDLLVEAIEVLRRKKLHYGVGNMFNFRPKTINFSE